MICREPWPAAGVGAGHKFSDPGFALLCKDGCGAARRGHVLEGLNASLAGRFLVGFVMVVVVANLLVSGDDDDDISFEHRSCVH